MEKAARIEKLRQSALDNYTGTEEFLFYFYEKWSANETLPKYERYAEAYTYAFSMITPAVAAGELIVGRNTPLTDEAQRTLWEREYKAALGALHDENGQGQDSHMAVDIERVLEKGLLGVRKEIEELLAAETDGENAGNCTENTLHEGKAAWYRLCISCIDAVLVHAARYAEACEAYAEQLEIESAAEFREIARILRKVPANPAETFYEAVQSTHFVIHCLSFHPLRAKVDVQQFQLGRPDRYLWPYYEKDIANGTLTPEFAQLLIDCLGIQINMRMPNGFSSGYLVGGRDASGKTVQNDLTMMCMQVIDDIRLVYPAVGLCYTDDLEEKYLDAAVRILLKGRSHPAIFNDDVILRGLRHYGVPEEQAVNYVQSSCVEITPIGASNVWVASPYNNMLQMLLDCMEREYESFDALKQAVLDLLDYKIRVNFEKEDRDRMQRRDNCIHPFLSCLVKDCLGKGLDIEQGGADYNWIMPSFVGMANLVDSLYALKTVVFDEKRFTMAEMKAIVDSNFEGKQELRKELLNTIPKYGNDIDDVDALFGLFTEHVIKECEQYTGCLPNSRLIPSVFCWIMHERLGTETGASPDGRPAGFPLGDGSGPCQGRESCGPTASILSSTKWSHEKLIGGVAVNMKFSKRALGPDSAKTLKDLIRVFMLRGGFEIQINIVDRETLLAARKNPEQYRDLVVRIGGYSDYFVRLSENMQNEIILRTEHEI